MLFLTRRLGETPIFELPTGETIEVTVLEINGSQVRLGTEAPEQVHIIREELLFDEELAG
jgi:carbon storage regulator